MSIDSKGDTKPTVGVRESSNRIWCVVAVIGIAASLVDALSRSFPLEPRQPRQFFLAAVIIAATLVALRVLFRPAWTTFIAMPGLLAPVGVALLASTTIDVMVAMPLLSAMLTPSWSLSLLGLSLGLSVGTVLHMIVWTGFAAWQTDLLWRAARSGDLPELAPWIPIRTHFLRAFVVLAIGIGVLLASLVPAIALSAAVMAFGFLAVGAIGIVWNVLTVALLPVAMLSPRPLMAAIGEGFRRSWTLKGRWWKQLAAQLALLGLLVMIRAHFTGDIPVTDQRGVTSVRHETKTNVKWQINAFWVGGYENSCRWMSQYVQALETTQAPLIARTLAIVFLVVAAAMKWTVIRELDEYEAALQKPPPPSQE